MVWRNSELQNNNRLKFLDLFAGIGGVKIGFENNGFEAVFSNDIDINCKKTFDSNFSNICQYETNLFLKDIASVTSDLLPEFNLLTASFSCKPSSIARYRKGNIDKGKGDLFFEIIRILRDRKPNGFFLENVKTLKTHDLGRTLRIIYSELENLGYLVKDAVLNTMEYGNLPQNRERIYIVGFLSKTAFDAFSFPNRIKLEKSIHDCISKKKVNDKYYYNGKPIFKELAQEVTKSDIIYQWRTKYVKANQSNVCPTLTASMGTNGRNVPIILDDYGIRKLTPRECANFQGFPKDFLLPQIATSQLYKQIGSSVSIPVVSRIARQMKKAME